MKAIPHLNYFGSQFFSNCEGHCANMPPACDFCAMNGYTRKAVNLNQAEYLRDLLWNTGHWDTYFERSPYLLPHQERPFSAGSKDECQQICNRVELCRGIKYFLDGSQSLSTDGPGGPDGPGVCELLMLG